MHDDGDDVDHDNDDDEMSGSLVGETVAPRGNHRTTASKPSHVYGLCPVQYRIRAAVV